MRQAVQGVAAQEVIAVISQVRTHSMGGCASSTAAAATTGPTTATRHGCFSCLPPNRTRPQQRAVLEVQLQPGQVWEWQHCCWGCSIIIPVLHGVPNTPEGQRPQCRQLPCQILQPGLLGGAAAPPASLQSLRAICQFNGNTHGARAPLGGGARLQTQNIHIPDTKLQSEHKIPNNSNRLHTQR